jgi:hypothetical protein
VIIGFPKWTPHFRLKRFVTETITDLTVYDFMVSVNVNNSRRI